MDSHALNFAAPQSKPRRRHTPSEFARRAAEWELCVCPSCIAACPERLVIALRRRAVLRGRFRVVED